MAKKDMLQFTVDDGSVSALKRVQRLMADFGSLVTPAIARALNRAADGIATDAAQGVTQRYGVKSAQVKDAFRVVKRAMPQSLEAGVIASGTVVGLHRFGARPGVPTTHSRDKTSGRPSPRKGISVRVREKTTLENAFVATMRSGHTGIFVRGKGRGITELFGPSVPQMVRTAIEEDEDLIERGLDERFCKRLDHEVTRILGKN